MHVRLRKHLATLCALLMLVMCVGVLGACTFSETITQTIYDQDPSNEVDETKTLLVNSLKAKETSESLPQLTNDEIYAAQDTWDVIHATMPKYGFILRYTPDGEDITGYTYEPWHLRYVGAEAAQEIMGSGITLEEYLGAVDGSSAE